MVSGYSDTQSDWSPGEAGQSYYSQVAPAIIDNGTFKYVLIQTNDKEAYFVRGYNGCGYHADVFVRFQSEIPKDWKVKCIGGGRIEHTSDKIQVYGYSQGFGQPDHSISCKILSMSYDGKTIEWSNAGY